MPKYMGNVAYTREGFQGVDNRALYPQSFGYLKAAHWPAEQPVRINIEHLADGGNFDVGYEPPP